MKLYDCATAPSPRRVRIFVAEKKIDLSVVQVDLRAGEQFSPEFKAKNPQCTVPVLELDDGECIVGASAICLYLEELYPDPVLLGGDAKTKAQVAMWNQRMETEGYYAVAEAFRNSVPGLKGRALTGTDTFDQIPALVERGRARATLFFKMLNRRLLETEYVAGEDYSIADITALVTVDFASWIKLEPSAECTGLNRWHRAVSARPSAAA